MAFLSLSVMFYSRTYSRVSAALSQVSDDTERVKIVIDPGHGGNDPGGIGVSGVLEKDVNLSVALFLRKNFEAQGFEVVMTRDIDKGLYSETAKNKKKEDLAKRIEIIKEAHPDFVLCIHQNIFTDSKYSGAQVFYSNAALSAGWSLKKVHVWPPVCRISLSPAWIRRIRGSRNRI